MYIAKVNYMAVPLPRIWTCKFEHIEQARAAVAERYMQPEVQGYKILDEEGNVLEQKGVCLVVDRSTRH